MPILTRIASAALSSHHRLNPALRYCGMIDIVDAVEFSVSKGSRLRCAIRCNKASLVVADRVVIARGSDINSADGASIFLEEGVCIGKQSTLSVAGRATLSIGRNTTFYAATYISGNVTVGAECLFGQNVTILTGDHIIQDRRPIRIQDSDYQTKHGLPPQKPVSIGEDCWIGVNAVILPGVSLGKGCVVGAGAVVTSSFAEYSIVGGVPARLLRYR
jgi:carbonic anhydrase/acetyltransferase-like protein (isoleucine patch superfamily)